MEGGRRTEGGRAAGGRAGLLLNPYPAYERPLRRRDYRVAYRLTPLEFHRLRAQGFAADEVYMIANASRWTGWDPQVFANAIYRGLYGRTLAYEFNIDPRELVRILPEWRTQVWADAVGEAPLTRRRLNVIDFN